MSRMSSLWINVYPTDATGSFPSRKIADTLPYPNSRIAILEIVIKGKEIVEIRKHEPNNKSGDGNEWVNFIADKCKDG